MLAKVRKCDVGIAHGVHSESSCVIRPTLRPVLLATCSALVGQLHCLQKRGQLSAPPAVVHFLPLSSDADDHLVWNALLSRALSGASSGLAMDAEAPRIPTTTQPYARGGLKPTFVPPCVDRADPLAAVEIARSADVVVALVPSDPSTVAIDDHGRLALSVLAAMGLPSLFCLSVPPVGGSLSSVSDLKTRSAAKKRAAEVRCRCSVACPLRSMSCGGTACWDRHLHEHGHAQ